MCLTWTLLYWMILRGVGLCPLDVRLAPDVMLLAWSSVKSGSPKCDSPASREIATLCQKCNAVCESGVIVSAGDQ